MKVALESGFATDRLRFGICNYRAFIYSMRNILQPAAIAAAEVHLQKGGVSSRQFGDGGDTKRRQLLGRFRTDSIDFSNRERPDPVWDIRQRQDREAIRFFQV